MSVKPRAMMDPPAGVTPDRYRVTLPQCLQVSAGVYRQCRTIVRIATGIHCLSQVCCPQMSGAVVTCPAPVALCIITYKARPDHGIQNGFTVSKSRRYGSMPMSFKLRSLRVLQVGIGKTVRPADNPARQEI